MNVLFYFLLHLLISFISCVYRQDTYKFFDKFYLTEFLETFHDQNTNKDCSLKDGPNCFHLMTQNKLIGKELFDDYIKTHFKDHNKQLNVQNVYEFAKRELNKYKKKYKMKTEAFNIKPLIQRKLLINFESYDQQTLAKDVYMPEEKVIQFQVGHLRMNFNGKLRLTRQDDSFDRLDGPRGTYGVVDTEGILPCFMLIF